MLCLLFDFVLKFVMFFIFGMVLVIVILQLVYWIMDMLLLLLLIVMIFFCLMLSFLVSSLIVFFLFILGWRILWKNGVFLIIVYFFLNDFGMEVIVFFSLFGLLMNMIFGMRIFFGILLIVWKWSGIFVMYDLYIVYLLIFWFGVYRLVVLK